MTYHMVCAAPGKELVVYPSAGQEKETLQELLIYPSICQQKETLQEL